MSAAPAAPAEPIDPDTFLVCGVPYLIATRAKVRPDGSAPAAAVATLTAIRRALGDPAEFVPLFTDADLAERFVRAGDPAGTSFVAFRPASVGAFAVLLADLTRRCAWAGFDPRPGAGAKALYPTAAVLRAVVEGARGGADELPS